MTVKVQNKSKNIWNRIFKYSLLIYPITILLALFLGTVIGIDHGWAMPAWSDGTKMYGMQAVASYLIIFCVAFAWVYIPIIIYQVVYMIYKVIFSFFRTYFEK